MTIKLEYRHETPTLTDSEGGVWWPTADAAEAIQAAEDQEAEALSQERAGNGQWRA